MTLTRKQFLGAGLGLLAAPLVPPLARPAIAKEWTVIRVATEGAFPPYNTTAPDGKLIGYEPDICAEVAKRKNVKIELQAQAWDGIIPGLQDGKYDAIMDGMSITPKRLEVIAFSVPYANTPSGLTVMKDGPLAALGGTGTRVPLADEKATEAAVAGMAGLLKGKTIGVQTATIQHDVLNRFFKDLVTVRTYAAGPDTYLDLRNGRIDAVISSAGNAAPFIKRARGELMLAGPGFVGGPLGIGAGVGLRKADVELKALFDTALGAMAADGTLKALSMKWFESDVTPQG